MLVSVREAGTGHRGGTLTVQMNRAPDTIDTALIADTTSATILHMTGDGLVALDQASGLEGTQLVPDLAVSLPTPTDGGRTYTFRLRPNIRYSNGKLVKASDFRWTLERAFKLGFGYDGFVGAARCEQDPKRCNLSQGVVVDDAARTVTFHLVAADPEFLYGPAQVDVVPAGTPAREAGKAGMPPLPATGPYGSRHTARTTSSRSGATRGSTYGRRRPNRTAIPTSSSSRSAARPTRRSMR